MPAKKNSVTGDILIANMYERWTLDCVIGLAKAIAQDFVSRPRQYKAVDPEIAKILEDLWYRCDNDPKFPGKEKRPYIFGSVLGQSDGSYSYHDEISGGHQFHSAASDLRERARAYSERQVETGEDNLRTAFVDSLTVFRAYLITFQNNIVVTQGDRQTLNVFNASSSILKDPKIAAVFGREPVNEEDSPSWPLNGIFDENGAQIIEEVSSILENDSGAISQNQFTVMQRIGFYGAKTIEGAVSASKSSDLRSEISIEDVKDLIKSAYSWKTALDAKQDGSLFN